MTNLTQNPQLICQLSLFIENKPGKLLHPCMVLRDAGLNILTMSIADTAQFGILRIIVQDWCHAKHVLEENDCVVRVNTMVALEVPDQPGGLADMLQLFEEQNLNVEYMYAFTYKSPENRGILLFRFDDPETAITILSKHGVSIVDTERLFSVLT